MESKNREDKPVASLGGQQFQVVDKFTCMGSVFTSDNTLDAELSRRLSRAGAAFGQLRSVLWHDRRISLQTKMKVFRSVVLYALLYGRKSGLSRSHS